MGYVMLTRTQPRSPILKIDAESAGASASADIFCDDDGSEQFSKAMKCPALSKLERRKRRTIIISLRSTVIRSIARDTVVSGRFDIIRVDLKPSEQYKSMVLAGLKPDIVMEICTRSLSFWTYQTQHEKSYQEYVANKAKERAVQLENYYEQIVTRTHSELNSLKSQIAAAKKELEAAKKKYNEASEKLMEKSRQNQKLQSMYDTLRRRCITPCHKGIGLKNLAAGGDYNKSGPPHTASYVEEVLRDERPGSVQRLVGSSPPEREFVFRPNSTPVLHHGSSVSDLQSLHSRFNIDLHLAER